MPLLPPSLGLDSWSLMEHLIISEGVRTREGGLSRQKSLVLRRCWPALLSEPDIGMVPMLRTHLSRLPPPAFLMLFSPSCAFLTQLFFFFLLLLSSPVWLRAGGPKSFSVLVVHNFRKPCCLHQPWRGRALFRRWRLGEGWRNVTGMRNRCSDPMWLSL